MSQIPPHEALSIASSLVAGMFMLHISLRKKAIRWKSFSRCPSCGRSRRADAHCDNCC
jgi:hypothetical protein